VDATRELGRLVGELGDLTVRARELELDTKFINEAIAAKHGEIAAMRSLRERALHALELAEQQKKETPDAPSNAAPASSDAGTDAPATNWG